MPKRRNEAQQNKALGATTPNNNRGAKRGRKEGRKKVKKVVNIIKENPTRHGNNAQDGQVAPLLLLLLLF